MPYSWLALYKGSGGMAEPPTSSRDAIPSVSNTSLSLQGYLYPVLRPDEDSTGLTNYVCPLITWDMKLQLKKSPNELLIGDLLTNICLVQTSDSPILILLRHQWLHGPHLTKRFDINPV